MVNARRDEMLNVAVLSSKQKAHCHVSAHIAICKRLKDHMLWFVHLEKFSLNFSSLSFAIHVPY